MSDRPHTPRGERPARGRGSSRSSARPSRPPRAARPVRASGRPAAAVDFNSNSNRVFLPILAFAVIASLFVLRKPRSADAASLVQPARDQEAASNS